MNYFNMSKNYDYKAANPSNVSFAGTTENFIYVCTPSYTGIIPVYVGTVPNHETMVAGSLDNTMQDSSAPGSLHNAVKKNEKA